MCFRFSCVSDIFSSSDLKDKIPDLEASCSSQEPAARSDGRRFGAEMESEISFCQSDQLR